MTLTSNVRKINISKDRNVFVTTNKEDNFWNVYEQVFFDYCSEQFSVVIYVYDKEEGWTEVDFAGDEDRYIYAKTSGKEYETFAMHSAENRFAFLVIDHQR